MDLFSVVIINLIVAGGLYLLFSIRFKLTIKKAIESGVAEHLKENILLAMQLIEQSLQKMEEDNKVFYTMLRRAEELNRELESKTRKSKKLRKDSVADNRKTEEASAVSKRSANTSILNDDSDIDALWSRTLAKQKDDQFQLTEYTPSSRGRSSAFQEEEPSFSTKDSLTPSWIEKAGKIVSRAIGLDSSQFGRSQNANPTSNTSKSRYGDSESSTKTNPDKKDTSDTGDSSEQGSLEFLELTKAAYRRQSEPKPEPFILPKSDSIDLSLEARVELENKKGERIGPNRMEQIRIFLDAGMTSADIARVTGVSVAEIDLLSQLPKGSGPKRKRTES